MQLSAGEPRQRRPVADRQLARLRLDRGYSIRCDGLDASSLHNFPSGRPNSLQSFRCVLSDGCTTCWLQTTRALTNASSPEPAGTGYASAIGGFGSGARRRFALPASRTRGSTQRTLKHRTRAAVTRRGDIPAAERAAIAREYTPTPPRLCSPAQGRRGARAARGHITPARCRADHRSGEREASGTMREPRRRCSETRADRLPSA